MSTADGGGTESVLGRLIETALERRERGEKVDPTELCREHPGLLPALLNALRLEPELAELHQHASASDPLLGRVLRERYRLAQPIGSGAMGAVYRAHDLELKREVAVKLLQAELFGGPEAAGRFDREAEVLAVLKHPSIVVVHDRGRTDDGLMFLVMELVDGASFADVLRRAEVAAGGDPRLLDETGFCGELAELVEPGALPESTWLRLVVSWAADLASGLHAAHAAGVFHRDVKPSNVLVRKDGPPVLLDFGIAARDAHATLASRDNVLGTPAYMAPEQATGQGAPGAALDVYGLCATLYHLVTLRAPYEGSPTEVLARLARRDPEPAVRLHPGLPRDLQAILDKGMARDPRKRYPSAAALEADLRAFLAHRPVSARPVTALERTWRRVRRSREFRAAAVVLALVLVVGAGLVWSANTAERRQAAWRGVWSRVPPSVCLSGDPRDRSIADEEERAEVRALLDAAVGLQPDFVASRLLRATFRLDHGDPAGAAADFERIAAVVGSRYAEELAGCYRALGPDASSHLDLALDGLPEPATDDDRFLAGFHVLRAGTGPEAVERARELLEEPADAGHVLSLELLAPTLIAVAHSARTRGQRAEAVGWFRRAHDIALRLEGALGGPTALTYHVLGAALVGQERYREAIDPLERCVALWPRAHGSWGNLAIAHRRLGDLDAAEQCLRDSLRIRHNDAAYRTRFTLVQVLVDRGDFDAARSAVAEIPFPEGPDGAALRARLEGQVYREQAKAAVRDGDPAAARTAAQHACVAFEAALDAGDKTAAAELAASQQLVAGDPHAVLEAYFDALAADPVNWRHLENLEKSLPAELSSSHVRALRRFLSALVRHLAPSRAETAGSETDTRPKPSESSATRRDR